MQPTLRSGIRAAIVSISVACPAWAQARNVAVDRVAWPLVDFLILGDSTRGVQLLVSPNLHSAQGREQGDRSLTLMLEPLPLRRWANAVAALVDSFSNLPREEQNPFATVALPGDLGRAGIRLYADPKRSKKTPFYLEIRDSADLFPKAKTPEWLIAATRTDVLALLTTLDAVAQRSVYDPTPRTLDSGLVYQVSELERPPALSHQWHVEYPEREEAARHEGRVLLQFVIDTSGVVMRETVRVLMTDGVDFTDAALQSLDKARYLPAVALGRPVRVIVWQLVNFTLPSY